MRLPVTCASWTVRNYGNTDAAGGRTEGGYGFGDGGGGGDMDVDEDLVGVGDDGPFEGGAAMMEQEEQHGNDDEHAGKGC